MLLRHAKAEKAAPGVRDRDRRLNARGQGDAALIAAHMVRHELQPSRVLVSSAQRTRETWGCMAQAFAAAPIAYEDRLYESGPETVLAVIRELGRSAPLLLVIGHNPGFQELASLLSDVATGRLPTRIAAGFPTGALAGYDLTVPWSALDRRRAHLVTFVTPKELHRGE